MFKPSSTVINSGDAATELIVLVHGFGAPRVVMWLLATRLRASGFRVVLWNYSSLFTKIDVHAERLHGFLATQFTAEPRIHIVAHSMGSIVTRAALERAHLPKLGRVVLLAPPNAGSPVARFASIFVGALITPTRELSDDALSIVNQLRSNDATEIGIIAARYDFLVPLKNTHLLHESMHVTLNATHNSLLFSRLTCQHIVSFLRLGLMR